MIALLCALVALTIDANAKSSRTESVTNAAAANVSSVPKVRQTRLASPFYGFTSIWYTLGNIRRLFVNVSIVQRKIPTDDRLTDLHLSLPPAKERVEQCAAADLGHSQRWVH